MSSPTTMNAAASRHVLIADDYPDAAQTLSDFLEDVYPDCVIDVAMDGRQALDLALAHRPSAAVLDIEMPLMSGIEVGLAVRRQLNGSMLLIAMSGNHQNLDKARASGSFDHVLSKPVDLDALVELLAVEPGPPA